MFLIIFIALFVWQYKKPGIWLPSALLSGFFALGALASLDSTSGMGMLLLVLYGFFAYTSGKRALMMKRAGAPMV